MDVDSKKILPGATISLLNTSSKNITDSEGNFSITNVKVGRQSLEVTIVGYEPRTVNNVIVHLVRRCI